MKPLKGHRIVSFISLAFLFIAFLLLLLVSLSLPIIKSIYILSLTSTSTALPQTTLATQINFGVWGLCASSVVQTGTECYGPQLGYNIPASLSNLAGISPTLVQAVEQGLLVILVLHPVAGGLSLLALLWSLFLESHPAAIFTLIITIVNAIVASLVFAIDLALVLIARAGISQDLPTFHLAVNWGNAVWMVLVAVIMTWSAVVSLSARVCYCLGVRKLRSY